MGPISLQRDGTTGPVSLIRGCLLSNLALHLRLALLRFTGKTEYDIDTWSYRRGLWDGYIPQDISNASTLVFPLRGDGCIDDGAAYQAPSRPGSGYMQAHPGGAFWTIGVAVSLCLIVPSMRFI